MNTEIFDLGKIGITLGHKYDNKAIYEKLTIVLYKGKSYISTKNTQGISPEQSKETWQLVAEAKDAYHMLVDAGKTTLTEEEFLNQLEDATKGRYLVQGNIINAADEEDLTVEHSDILGIDTLKLADRPSTDGMGYVILRKNKSFAEQVTKANTIYEIRYDFNIGGVEVTIPEGCVLKFEGGMLLNGLLVLNNTSFEGKPMFSEMSFKGTNNISHIDASWFKTDDNKEKLASIFSLINESLIPVVVDLEKDTIYDISFKTTGTQTNLYELCAFEINKSDLVINGNGSTIRQTNPIDDLDRAKATACIIRLNNCSYVDIHGLSYRNENEFESDGIETYKKEGPAQCAFIGVYGKCTHLNIDVSCYNASYGITQHVFQEKYLNLMSECSDCAFKVNAIHCRFGVATGLIKDSSIYVHSEGHHRAAYISGADNCNIYVEGKEQWRAPIMCVLQHTRYKENGEIKYKANNNLNVHVKSLDGNNASGNTNGVILSLFGFDEYGSDLYERTERIECRNINVVIDMPSTACDYRAFEYALDDYSQHITSGDKYSDISICVLYKTVEGINWKSWCKVISANDTIVNIDFQSNGGGLSVGLGEKGKVSVKDSSLGLISYKSGDITLDRTTVDGIAVEVSTNLNGYQIKKLKMINESVVSSGSGLSTGQRIALYSSMFTKDSYYFIMPYADKQNSVDVRGYDNRGLPIVLFKGEFIPAIIEKAGTSRPTSPYIGQMFFDTSLTTPKMIVWNGEEWINLDGSHIVE